MSEAQSTVLLTGGSGFAGFAYFAGTKWTAARPD